MSAAAILATSCTDDKEQIPAGNDKSTFVNLTLAAYESADGFDDNLTLQAAHACLFEDGFMTEVYETPVLEGGSYGFRVGKKTGTLYVVADAIDMETLNGLRDRGIGEDEWLGLTIGSNGNLPRRFASGRAELSGNGVGTIAMTAVQPVSTCMYAPSVRSRSKASRLQAWRQAQNFSTAPTLPRSDSARLRSARRSLTAKTPTAWHTSMNRRHMRPY